MYLFLLLSYDTLNGVKPCCGWCTYQRDLVLDIFIYNVNSDSDIFIYNMNSDSLI